MYIKAIAKQKHFSVFTETVFLLIVFNLQRVNQLPPVDILVRLEFSLPFSFDFISLGASIMNMIFNVISLRLTGITSPNKLPILGE